MSSKRANENAAHPVEMSGVDPFRKDWFIRPDYCAVAFIALSIENGQAW